MVGRAEVGGFLESADARFGATTSNFVTSLPSKLRNKCFVPVLMFGVC